MKLHHKIIALVIGAAFVFASVTMIIDYSMSRDKLLNDYSSLNKNRDSKTSSDKKVRYIENSVNESGSINIVTQDSGTFGDLAQGSSNSSFGSSGDNTSNKQTNDGVSQDNSSNESSEENNPSNENSSQENNSSGDSSNQSSGNSSSQGNSSNTPNIENTQPTSTELFATVSGGGIAYNWNASVNVEGIGIVNAPSEYGINREGGDTFYTKTNWSSGSRQRALYNKIINELYVDDGYVMWNGCLLVAAPISDPSWVGCYGTMNDSSGHSVKVVYADAKGNKGADVAVVNYNQTPGSDPTIGHWISGSNNVIEIFCWDGYTAYDIFNAKFGTSFSKKNISGWSKGQSII